MAKWCIRIDDGRGIYQASADDDKSYCWSADNEMIHLFDSEKAAIEGLCEAARSRYPLAKAGMRIVKVPNTDIRIGTVDVPTVVFQLNASQEARLDALEARIKALENPPRMWRSLEPGERILATDEYLDCGSWVSARNSASLGDNCGIDDTRRFRRWL